MCLNYKLLKKKIKEISAAKVMDQRLIGICSVSVWGVGGAATRRTLTAASASSGPYPQGHQADEGIFSPV